MVSTTKKTAANRVTEVLDVTEKRRMHRHSPEQKVAILDAIVKEAFHSQEFNEILDKYGVNPSAFVRWMKETRG